MVILISAAIKGVEDGFVIIEGDEDEEVVVDNCVVVKARIFG